MTTKEKLEVFAGIVVGLAVGVGFVAGIFTLAIWRVGIGWQS